MKKHIHIHIPAKKPQVAYLMRAKAKDASTAAQIFEKLKKNTKQLENQREYDLQDLQKAYGLDQKEAQQLLQMIKNHFKPSGTKDSSLFELQDKRDKLEAEFDKADDSGDNRAMERIRKELAALDKQIEAEKKKEKGTADAGLGKLIKTLTSDRTMVKVYFDAEWEEYIARLYYKKPFGWQEQTKASYHSDDKEDALSTAADMLRRAESRTKDAGFSTFPSLYKTARDPKSGSVYKVIGQNNKSKEASTHLLLKMPHGNSWWEVNKVEPVL